jgi:acyl carrier protein phosphodiesterase
MNYLVSTSFVSGNKEAILGCLIAETGRSTRLSNFESGIQKGIDLHLEIHAFLENHAVTFRNAKRLPFLFQKHNLEILETFFDHFIALKWDTYSNCTLSEHSNLLYSVPSENQGIIHSKLKKITIAMIQNKWFLKHNSISGLSMFLNDYIEYGFCRINFAHTVPFLIEYYDEIKSDFEIFYHDLQEHIYTKFPELESTEKSQLVTA